jgi:hypothetical protein
LLSSITQKVAHSILPIWYTRKKMSVVNYYRILDSLFFIFVIYQ